MGTRRQGDAPTYFCENISSIEYRDGLFYITDDCGEFLFRRCMRPSTFLRCVANAARFIEEFEESNSAVAGLQGIFR